MNVNCRCSAILYRTYFWGSDKLQSSEAVSSMSLRLNSNAPSLKNQWACVDDMSAVLLWEKFSTWSYNSGIFDDLTNSERSDFDDCKMCGRTKWRFFITKKDCGRCFFLQSFLCCLLLAESRFSVGVFSDRYFVEQCKQAVVKLAVFAYGTREWYIYYFVVVNSDHHVAQSLH